MDISLNGARTYSVALDGTVVNMTRSKPAPTPPKHIIITHKLIALKQLKGSQ